MILLKPEDHVKGPSLDQKSAQFQLFSPRSRYSGFSQRQEVPGRSEQEQYEVEENGEMILFPLMFFPFLQNEKGCCGRGVFDQEDPFC